MGVFLQEASSNEDSLSLATRKLGAQITYLRLIAIWHLHDSIMNTTLSCYFLDFILCCVLVTVFQVEFDGVIEQDSVLWDDRDVLSERLEFKVFDVLSIDQD